MSSRVRIVTRRRTTARGALFLLTLAAIAAAAARAERAPAAPADAAVERIVFPVVGRSAYTDDYGAPRPNGKHAGIDITTGWRTPAVAAEAGRIRLWTTSPRAGCMLYLYGQSGTTYLYIHLNNDLTRGRDNAGGCVPGVAYAPGLQDGAVVEAGELIAWGGDSGDAEGTYHLHFEVHPDDGGDVTPLPYLDAAERRLFPGRPGTAFTLGLRGIPTAVRSGVLELRVTAVRWWPGGRWTPIDARTVSLATTGGADVDATLATLFQGRRTSSRGTVSRVTVFTTPAQTTEAALRGDPGALVAGRVVHPDGIVVDARGPQAGT